MIDKPIMFVHVPKTAGTSINNALRNRYTWNIPPGPPRPYHDPLFILEKYNDLSKFFVFAVVRNPFTRAYSYYKHYLKQNNCIVSFEQFLDHVRRRRQSILEHHDAEQIKRDKTPFIVYPQSFYLFDSKGAMSIDKLYRYESMAELEQDFQISLPKMNVGSYSKDDYLEAYSQTNIDLVRHIYLEDFINLGYSTNFS